MTASDTCTLENDASGGLSRYVCYQTALTSTIASRLGGARDENSPRHSVAQHTAFQQQVSSRVAFLHQCFR